MNIIDSTINFFSPSAGLKRAQSRLALEVVGRKYEAATAGRRNGGWFRPNTTAAQEVSSASAALAATSQDLTRNNPLAKRVRNVWANNVVGKGITAELKGTTDNKTKKANHEFKAWFESTNIDYEGHYDGAGLEHLWVRTLVESGGVFIRKHVKPVGNGLPALLQLQTIEPSFLDKGKNGLTDKGSIIDGIQFDGNGQIEGYWFLREPTGTNLSRKPESKFHNADNIIHIFDKERSGQHLGVTWLATIANTLKEYSTYKDAKLMQQQIAACFALIVTDAERAMGGVTGDGSATLPDSIEPAMIEYIKSGQEVNTITPPKADNATSFEVGLKADSASGVGLTYEMLTGDYSKVNFASGRMGKTEFYNELDHVQLHVMKPALNKIVNWYIDLYNISRNMGTFTIDWTFPPRAAVNPKEELDVILTKVRNGLMSPQKAAKQYGELLDTVVTQWKDAKELFGDLPFDIDPSLFASTGNQLDDNDAASENKSDGNTESNKNKSKKVESS